LWRRESNYFVNKFVLFIGFIRDKLRQRDFVNIENILNCSVNDNDNQRKGEGERS
jgi:hypothetical protein